MAGMIGRCVTGLLYMMIISVSSGTVYVQSGSDITECNMTCLHDDVTLELYRQCGGEDRTLLENHCHYNFTKSHDSRLQLHTGSGCWKLANARKADSCVYNVWCHCAPGYVISSTEIRVLDPVLISSITSNLSRLGEEMAVSVQFSGEESAVTWEVDGEPLPERYRLIDDNRTLIIPSVQRDDAERRFRVRITNPVSEEIREYRLEIRDLKQYRGRIGLIAVLIVSGILAAVIVSPTSQNYCWKREKTKVSLQTEPPDEMERGALTTPENICFPDVTQNKAAPIIKNGHVPIIECGSLNNNHADPSAVFEKSEENG